MTATSRASARGGWRLLGAGLRQRRRPLVRMAVWSAVEATPALASGACVAAAIDRGFLAGRPWTGVGWLAVYGAALAIKAVATSGMFRPLADTVEPLRDGLVQHVVAGALDRAIDSDVRTGTAAVAQLTEQVQPVRGIVALALMGAREVGVALVAALAGLALLAPATLVVVVPPVLLSLVLFATLLPRLGRRKRAVILAEEAIGGELDHVLARMRDVVASGGQDRTEGTIGRLVDADAAAQRAYGRSEAQRLLVSAVGGQLPLLAVLLAVPWLSGTAGLSTGELVGAVTYLVASLDPALSSCLAMVAAYGVQLAVTMDRLAETGPATRYVPATATGTPMGHQIHAETICFTYGAGARPIVDRLSLIVPEDDHIAIVGPSGIGKSTLAGLLAGLVPPGQGRIWLGGVPTDRLRPDYIRRLVALVPQEAYVFTGTLRENLAYLNPHSTDANLDRAVDAVGMRHLVHRLGGYDTPLGTDAVALSAGERQLVTLARVYLSPARVVILDEGTCHLDPAAEAVAEAAFAARPGTLIVIAHRVTSAMRANRIIVMDGHDIWCGTHAQLVVRSELYRTMLGHWTAQHE